MRTTTISPMLSISVQERQRHDKGSPDLVSCLGKRLHRGYRAQYIISCCSARTPGVCLASLPLRTFSAQAECRPRNISSAWQSRRPPLLPLLRTAAFNIRSSAVQQSRKARRAAQHTHPRTLDPIVVKVMAAYAFGAGLQCAHVVLYCTVLYTTARTPSHQAAY